MSARVSWRIDVSIDGVLSAGREVKWTFPVETVRGDCLAISIVDPVGLCGEKEK